MKFLFLLLLTLQQIYSKTNKYDELKSIFLDTYINQNLNDQQDINRSLLMFLDSFPNFDHLRTNDMELYNNCTNYGKLFEKTNGVDNFLHFLSYSGKELSDLGQELACTQKNFSYYIFSYNYKEKEDNITKVFQFLEKDNFYTGICLYDNCLKLFQKLFKDYSDDIIKEVKIDQITNREKYEEINCENNNDDCKYLPYYTLDENGDLDLKEKKKYEIFELVIKIIIIILCIEICVSIFIYCGYNTFNNSKDFIGELYEENDLNDDYDEENTDENQNDKILFSNNSLPSSKKKKHEPCFKIFVKLLYKYLCFLTKIIVLTMRKSKFYNNKNMEVITKLRLFVLILISFSANFDVFINFPSKGFYNELFYKEFYFIFLKFASFGLDMYICLDGFEVMFKLMNYYKKNFYYKNNHRMSFKGILKFYFFSIYKIIAYIILFFIVNYFNRYYIYMHNRGALYTYYSTNINNKTNDFLIFNPKYNILSFLFGNTIDDKFLTCYRISLLFVNEFFAFTLVLIIFYIGNILKSKIYDYAVLIYIFISYLLSYPLCSLTDDKEYYTYNLIMRKISLIKFPLIFFNHYLIGCITGLVCFYFKDSTMGNSMINEPDKCPFHFGIKIVAIFDFLIQKTKKLLLFFSFFIQFLICIIFTVLLIINKDEQIPIEFNTSLKIIYYYESGLFIFTFCINTIIFFADSNEVRNSDRYNLLNLIYQINFSYLNTIYLMMYSYYCYFDLQLKLTYQNLWFITIGFFIFFCIENIIITILFIMPSKIIFKTILDKCLIINSHKFSIDTINDKRSSKKIDSSGFPDGNYEED